MPSTGETTIFVYDASGKMVAEYSTVVASSANAKVSYLTSDHLGSPRITTDANGGVTSRRDFMPFGEEIAASGSRAGYGTDTVRQKFTSYERDNESEEDFAQARYYNYKLGRFNSVDPLMASADIINPQTFNRYAYVGNNPLNITDPTGEQWGVNKDTNVVQWFEGALGAGFTAYNLLYATVAGTSQMVALNATTGAAVEVASAAAWLEKEVAWGETASTLGASAAALAGVPLAIATTALAKALDPEGRWQTGMNMPEPAREFAGTKQSYWNEFLNNVNKNSQVLMNENTSESDSSSSANTQEDNKPTDHAKQRQQEARGGDANRDVGDPNRVVREGKAYRDEDTGYTVYVKGNRAVVYDGNTQVTQFKNSRRNTQNRVNSGRWTPLK